MRIFEEYKNKYYFKIKERIIEISDLDLFYQVCELVIENLNLFYVNESEGKYFTVDIKLPVECLELKENRYFSFRIVYETKELFHEEKIHPISEIKDAYSGRILYENSSENREIQLSDIVLNDDGAHVIDNVENIQRYFTAINYILMIYRFFENNEKYKMVKVKLNKGYIETYMGVSFRLEKPTEKDIKNTQIKNKFK